MKKVEMLVLDISRQYQDFLKSFQDQFIDELLSVTNLPRKAFQVSQTLDNNSKGYDDTFVSFLCKRTDRGSSLLITFSNLKTNECAITFRRADKTGIEMTVTLKNLFTAPILKACAVWLTKGVLTKDIQKEIKKEHSFRLEHFLERNKN